jgi:UDP-glucose-4-epimerase GalE
MGRPTGSVLVTGGAGYIGSHTVRLLVEQGRRVVVLDSLEAGHPDAVLGAPLVVGDVADRELVVSTCMTHGVTEVVHFAAYKNVGESMIDPGRYWRNNVAGTVELVEALLTAGIGSIVFSSSCSVYGTPAQVPVDESAPIDPQSVYAASKAMIEQVLGWYGVTHGLRSVNLRYFNAAGASADARIGEDWTVTLNLVPVAMKAVLGRGEPVEVFGNDYPTPDGTAIRDYVHVDDLADAHARAVDHLAAGGESLVLNLGTGMGSSVLQVLDATARVARRPVPHTFGPRRLGDPVEVYADPTAAFEALGWRATRTLEDIIESAYRWHSTHLDGYRRPGGSGSS